MRAMLKAGIVVIVPETDIERAEFAVWRGAMQGHVFRFDGGTEAGGALLDIGPQADACRLPINILFADGPPALQPISNLALTPFVLDGRDYASVEGFWQGLKFVEAQDRARIAGLWGLEARRCAYGRGTAASFVYAGAEHPTGGPFHRRLMARACEAKFSQNLAAREALLATGRRPLTHRVRRDSEAIPGALMADIWMRLRAKLSGIPPNIA